MGILVLKWPKLGWFSDGYQTFSFFLFLLFWDGGVRVLVDGQECGIPDLGSKPNKKNLIYSIVGHKCLLLLTQERCVGKVPMHTRTHPVFIEVPLISLQRRFSKLN